MTRIRAGDGGRPSPVRYGIASVGDYMDSSRAAALVNRCLPRSKSNAKRQIGAPREGMLNRLRLAAPNLIGTKAAETTVSALKYLRLENSVGRYYRPELDALRFFAFLLVFLSAHHPAEGGLAPVAFRSAGSRLVWGSSLFLPECIPNHRTTISRKERHRLDQHLCVL